MRSGHPASEEKRASRTVFGSSARAGPLEVRTSVVNHSILIPARLTAEHCRHDWSPLRSITPPARVRIGTQWSGHLSGVYTWAMTPRRATVWPRGLDASVLL